MKTKQDVATALFENKPIAPHQPMNTQTPTPATYGSRSHTHMSLTATLTAFVSAMLLGLVPSSYATSDSWGGASSSTWATIANWATSPATVPGTGDTATFNGAGGGNTTISLGAGVTIGKIVFDTASAAAYTIGSGGVGAQTLTFDNAGSVTNAGTVANKQLFNANIVLGDGSAQTYNWYNTATAANTLTFAGTLQGGTGGTPGIVTLNVNAVGPVIFSNSITAGGASSVNLVETGAGSITLGGSGISTLNTLRGTTTGGASVTNNGQSITVASSSVYGTSTIAGRYVQNAGSVAFNGGIQAATSSGQLAGGDGIAVIVNGGTFTASYVGLGRSQNLATSFFTTAQTLTAGFLVNNNSIASVTGNVDISGSNSSAEGQVSGTATLTVGGSLNCGIKASGLRNNLFQVTGGTLNVTNTTTGGIVIARGNATEATRGQLLITGGTATTEKITFGLSGGLAGSTGNLTLNGATAALYIGSGGIVNDATAAYTYAISLMAGTLGAKTNWSSSLNMSLDGAGVTIKAADASGVSNNITLGGAISGANGFTKTGAGTLILSGANSYSGNTVISAGTLQVGNGGTTGNLGTADSTALTNNGTLLAFNRSDSFTFAGSIRGSGALLQAGTGILTLTGDNSYAGDTTVSSGTLRVSNATGSGTGSGIVTVASGATLGGIGTISGAVTSQNGGILAPGASVGALTVGSLTLNTTSTNNFEFNSNPTNDIITVTTASGLTVNGGVFNLYQEGGVTGWTTPGTYNLISFSGTAPSLNSGWTTSSATNPHIGNPQAGRLYAFSVVGGWIKVTISAAAGAAIGTWSVNSDGNWSVAGNWTGSGTMPPNNAGASATLGVGTVLRTVNLNANETVGTLVMTNANSFIITNSANTLTLDGSGGGASVSVSAGTQNAIQTPVSMNDNVGVAVSSGKALSISGVISSTDTTKTLTVNGAGTLALSGNNTYGPASSGSTGTTLSGGTLQLAHNNALGAGDLNVTANSTVNAAASLTVPNNISVAFGASAALDNANPNSLTLGGVISGSGSIIKNSNGTLNLTGANTYSGGTVVNAGLLNVTADGQLGAVPGSATTNMIVLNGGALLGSSGVVLNANRGVGIGATSGSTGGTAYLNAAAADSLTVSGVMASAGNSGTNDLVINGLAGSTGTVTLGGANTFNGSTVISNGTLTLANSLALQNSSLIYSNQGGVLSFGSLTAASVAALNGSQNLDISGVTLTLGANNTPSSYTGSLSGSGSLRKTGNGSLSLSNPAYTGFTTVYGGNLNLAGGTFAGQYMDLSGQNGAINAVISGGDFTYSVGGITTANFYITSSSGGSGTIFGAAVNVTITNGAKLTVDAGTVASGRAISYGNGSARPPSGSLTIGTTGDTTTLVTANGALDMFWSLGGSTVGNFAVNLNGGTLAVNSIQQTTGNASATQSSTFKFNGGTLKALADDYTVSPNLYTFMVGWLGATILTNGGAIIDANGHNITIGSAITHGSGALTDGGLTKIGAGTLTLTNANSYNGGTVVKNGTLAINGQFALGGAVYGGLTLSNASTLQYTAPPLANTADVSVFNGLTLGVGGATIDLNGNPVTYGFGIGNNGSGSLAVVSTTPGGVLTLNGANAFFGGAPVSYSGGTTVDANSTLVVNSTAGSATGSGAVTVNGVLGGRGLVAGNTTVNGSTYPGFGQAGAGATNTFGGNLTYAGSGSTFHLGATATGGGNDMIVLTNNSATLDFSSTIQINIDCGASLDQSHDYVLFKLTGTSPSILNAGNLNPTPNFIASTPAYSADYTIYRTNNTVVLHVNLPSPNITSATATPNPALANQTVVISVAATPVSPATIDPNTGVVVDISGLGGSSAYPLVYNGAGSYTNRYHLNPDVTSGSLNLLVSVTDSASLLTSTYIPLTVGVTNLTWNGGGTPGNKYWSNFANWVGLIQPALNGDSFTFAGNVGLVADMENNYSVAALTFSSGAGAFHITNSLGGSTLTLNGNVTNNSANTQTFDVPVALSNAVTINAANGAVLLTSPVLGASALNIAGTTVTLTGTNIYTSDTTISSGTLAISGAGQLGSGTYSGAITDNGNLTDSSSASNNLAGIISGSGTVTVQGPGDLMLSANNSYTGGTIIRSGGTVEMLSNHRQALGSGTLTLSNGTVVCFNTTQGGVVSNNVACVSATTNRITANNGTGVAVVLQGNISGNTATLELAGTNNGATQNSVDLSGDNSANSGVFHAVNNLNVRFRTAASGNTPNVYWQLGNTGSIITSKNDNNPTTYNLGALSGGSSCGLSGHASSTGAANTTYAIGALGLNTTFDGRISDGNQTSGANSNTIIKVGSGVLTLGGTNTYTGSTVISNGTLVVNGAISNSLVTVAGGALGGSGTIIRATALNAGTLLAPGNSGIGTLTFGGDLALNATSTNSFVVTSSGGVSNPVVVIGQLSPNGSVIKVHSGTALALGTYPLFSYGSISGSFNGTPVFDVAPSSTASITLSAGVVNLVISSSFNPAPTNIVAVVSGNQLQMSWPSDHTGWLLQSNSVDLANTNDWFTVPGSSTTNQVNVTINPASAHVFYRMKN